ncbi:hypothetical protein Y032_0014g2429 [Ancylostoma ceylanicum]|nr:hypothetical protein Y032_0014g2429 [Ancylostoma ceylanicum]
MRKVPKKLEDLVAGVRNILNSRRGKLRPQLDHLTSLSKAVLLQHDSVRQEPTQRQSPDINSDSRDVNKQISPNLKTA